jgi:hypothetical protein
MLSLRRPATVELWLRKSELVILHHVGETGQWEVKRAQLLLGNGFPDEDRTRDRGLATRQKVGGRDVEKKLGGIPQTFHTAATRRRLEGGGGRLVCPLWPSMCQRNASFDVPRPDLPRFHPA